MRIAIHDSDAEHFKTHDKFPNLALMKISAWHKARGDTVEWFNAIESHLYDKVYSSKIFDFTPENDYLPPDTIKGGTGYGLFEDLPKEIDDMFPDYSIYPECDYAIGFPTRGCPNKCSNCYVPQKEGNIRPYRIWQEIVRPDTKKLVLMDNNITAHQHGIEQLRQLSEMDYVIDINQKPQIEGLYKAAKLLEEAGIPNSKLFVYVLLTKDLEDNLERIYALRKLKAVTIYGMPYKDMRIGVMPDRWQNVMAQKYISSGQWRKIDWHEWVETHKSYF